MVILTVSLALMILLATCRYGVAGLTRLADLRLRGGTLALLAASTQVISVLVRQQRLALLIIGAILLAWFCWLNRRHLGIWLAAAGIALNMTVMVANGGTMPVNRAAIEQKSGMEFQGGEQPELTKATVLDDSDAALAWLGDRWLLPGPLARLAVWSIGDLLLLAGVWHVLATTMKGRKDDPSELQSRAALP